MGENKDRIPLYVDPRLTVPIVITTFVIYVPFCLYVSYPLYKQRFQVILKKRYVSLSLWTILFMILTLMLDSINLLFKFQVIPTQNHNTWQYIANINNAMLLSAATIFITLMLIRIWLIYFHCKYNSLTSNIEWKSIIDTTYNKKESFWIKHKSSLGNKKFIGRILIINSIVIAIISISGMIVPILDGIELLVEVEIFACFIFIGYIYFKLRSISFLDHFHIVEEFRLFGSVALISIVITLSVQISVVMLTIIKINDIKIDLYATICFYVIDELFYWIICLIIYLQTRYVLRMIQNDPALRVQYGEFMPIKTKMYGGHHVTAISGSSPTMNDIEIYSNRLNQVEMHQNQNSLSIQNKPKKISLQMILERDEYLLAFINHLKHEFSLECILALIEFTEFKQFALKTDIENTVEDNSDDDIVSRTNTNRIDAATVKLAKCIPKSSIVHSNDSLRIKAKLLFEKYVAIGSEHEINIHYRVRGQLIQKYQTLSILKRFNSIPNTSNYADDDVRWEAGILSCEFDECVSEMAKLLGYSLSRFKLKPDYVRLQTFDQ